MTLPLSLKGEVRTLNGAQRSLAFVGEGEDTIRLASNTLTPALSLKGEGEEKNGIMTPADTQNYMLKCFGQ